MSRPKNLKTQILQLSREGKSYTQIASILHCSKGSVSYHIGIGQKEKSILRVRKKRARHPFTKKLENFLGKKQIKPKTNKQIHELTRVIYLKLHRFQGHKMNNNSITVQDVINKFGENPKCYLTGEQIDISKPKTYSFDHKIPASRGGDNSLENLEICTKLANMSKTDMTYDEYINHCKKVVEHHSPKSN